MAISNVTWTDLPYKKAVAVIIWLLAVACTQQVVAPFLPLIPAWIGALLFQAGFTMMESPIWRRTAYDSEAKEWYPRSIGLMNIAALIIDNMLNVAGIWLVVRRIHELPPLQAVAEMFGLGQFPPVRGGWAFGVCFLLGLLLCCAPEQLFYSDD